MGMVLIDIYGIAGTLLALFTGPVVLMVALASHEEHNMLLAVQTAFVARWALLLARRHPCVRRGGLQAVALELALLPSPFLLLLLLLVRHFRDLSLLLYLGSIYRI